ncbi:DUF748 domain-containing protein [Zunongwangia endophytica]|uniref:DUF748 domain-containing protein n=1 Tax=Zunongwangia endophytica TaxID=1808945 RepID=A0ABV8HCI2_9FLAO|nr:DUF748 domain-containing protein [Zunongwangia endophytica]MDN3596602.1 DUF748 domain-containing protein [Zunongwangia endophytica]
MTSEKKKRKPLKKKRYVVPITIITLLIILRLFLPLIVKNYVNKTLNNIPGYSGHVEDIDIALWRGAYAIDGLVLINEKAETETPLIDFPKTDISVEWKSLLKGKIVSEIAMHGPKFNYIFEDQQDSSATGNADTEDWTKALTDLVPIDINHLQINDGTANFVQLSTNPQIDMFMEKINLQATNLSNVVNGEKKLPSNIKATATSIGGGQVNLNGNMNLLREIPDMDLDFSLEKAKATGINDLTRRYAGVDFESGTFELYCEVAISDAYMKGYIKPMFINTKLIAKNDEGGIFKKLWEGFVGVFKFVLKNQGTDTLATKVPLEGDLSNVKSGIFSTVINIFENAWINAFQNDVNEEINFEDAQKKDK